MEPISRLIIFGWMVVFVSAQPCDTPASYSESSCATKKCPPPSHCEMIIPPCGKKPVPTCVCPKGLKWSECPNCYVTCLEFVSNERCDLGCHPNGPQCVCPPGQLIYKDKCRPEKQCPPLE